VLSASDCQRQTADDRSENAALFRSHLSADRRICGTQAQVLQLPPV
jgi:hypothetical protein